MRRDGSFFITAGQTHDVPLHEPCYSQRAGAVLADNAYDSNALRETIAQMEAEAATPSKRHRKISIPHDTELYKQRNQIEQFSSPSQAFSPLRDMLRSPHHPFRRLHTSRRHYYMVTMDVDRL